MRATSKTTLAPASRPRARARASTVAASAPTRVAIAGGGLIGSSCAFFLSKAGCEVTIIERVAVASAASGKGGGFLARDWGDGSPTEALHKRSFALHEALAGNSDSRRIGRFRR